MNCLSVFPFLNIRSRRTNVPKETLPSYSDDVKVPSSVSEMPPICWGVTNCLIKPFQHMATTHQLGCPCVTDDGRQFSSVEEWQNAVLEQPPKYLEPYFKPEVAETIEARIDELNSELRTLSLDIHGKYAVFSSVFHVNLSSFPEIIPKSGMRRGNVWWYAHDVKLNSLPL
jgi:hypothetical protein